MAKIADLEIKGRSGNTYSFAVYDLESSWAAVAGIYAITKRTVKQDNAGNKTGVHTWIYVGETDNLKERHAGHHKQVCFMNNGANCLSFLAEKDAKRRVSIETDIRNNGASWPCNDQ